MQESLYKSELFEGIAPELLPALFALARRQKVARGEYLFLLGGHADRLYVVLEGKVDVCFPLSFGSAVKDVAVETIGPGGALGWSSLVKPYRFTLSARAAERCEVAAFLRSELLSMLDADASLGHAFMGRLTEIIGRRLLTMQAMWGRELQRSISAGWTAQAGEGSSA